MKSKKKFISLLTAFVMAFTVFGCTGFSFAAEDDPGVEPDVTPAGVGEVVEPEEGTDLGEDPDAIEESEIGQNAGNEENGEIVPLGEFKVDGNPETTSVKLSWDPVAPNPEFGENPVYYEVTGGPTPVQTSETNCTIDGLKPNTQYTFTLTAYQEDLEGTPQVLDSKDVTVKTAPVKISVPGSINVTSEYRTLTFTWGSVSAKNGGKISYEIYAYKDGSPIATRTTTRSFKKTGLSPRAKKYTYFIKAVEKDSKGNVITRSDFGTLSGTPKGFNTLDKALTGLVSDPGYKAVLLQWNKMDGATGYKIYWRKGGERGNIDTVGRDSDGHYMKTFRSSKTRKYEIVVKPGDYEYLDTVYQKDFSGDKITYDKTGLKIMNHTYVYFYQFMIIPFYDDDNGDPLYTKRVPKDKYKSDALNKKTNAVAGKSKPYYNVVRNNTVLPMYVYESAKYNKPIYKTSSMNDGKKRGRLGKGHKFICWDKANGRVKFYEKKNVSNPSDTYWFAQKNAHVIQGYYMDNCRYSGKTDLSRSDYATGYSRKTVLHYVNHSGLSSKTGYLIWASKYAQHVYIFKGKKGNWKLINGGKNVKPNVKNGAWSNLCSSGKVGIQSRNGHYVIFGKQYRAKRSKYDYYYLSKLHSTVRLHSLLYKKGAKYGSKKYYNKVLGNPVSKGCIRLKPAAAEYIYKHVPKKTRTLVY